MTESGDRPVFRDRRRVDPETGELRRPQEAAASEPPGRVEGDQHVDPSLDPEVQVAGAPVSSEQDRVGELETALAERTLDLQRLQADYVNYKRRVDRDREIVRDGATASVLMALLPVLDDIDRAREHGELEGGFKAVAEAFGRTVSGLGLVRFGEVGDAFDPRIHEALMHAHDDDIDGPTCTAILQPGYRIGERIVRPARVAVAEPNEPAAASPEAAFDDES